MAYSLGRDYFDILPSVIFRPDDNLPTSIYPYSGANMICEFYFKSPKSLEYLLPFISNDYLGAFYINLLRKVVTTPSNNGSRVLATSTATPLPPSL